MREISYNNDIFTAKFLTPFINPYIREIRIVVIFPLPQIKINDTMDWLMSKLLSCKRQDQPEAHKYLVTRLRERLADKLDILVTKHCTFYR